MNAGKGRGCNRPVCLPSPPAERHVARRWTARTRFVPLAIFIAIVGGCKTTDRIRFSAHADHGDHAWIVAQTVDCKDASMTCGELHLIRGMACFELALADDEPSRHLACAADELEKGLALHPSPENALAYRKRLCEALRRLVAQPSSPINAEIRRRYALAAKTLYRTDPGNVAAQYHLASARFHTLQWQAETLTPASRPIVCSRLKRNLTAVLSAIKSAEHGTVDDWATYSERYHRLAFELGLLLQQSQCR